MKGRGARKENKLLERRRERKESIAYRKGKRENVRNKGIDKQIEQRERRSRMNKRRGKQNEQRGKRSRTNQGGGEFE
jgi:hypothetical protein